MFKKILSWLEKFDEKSSIDRRGFLRVDEKEAIRVIGVHEKLRNEAFTSFDKAILTISVAGIGWIFLNIKDNNLFPYIYNMKIISFFFGCSILSTILSFYLAAYGNMRHAKEMRKCLSTGDLRYMRTHNTWQMRLAEICNFFSLFSFVAALVTSCWTIISI